MRFPSSPSSLPSIRISAMDVTNSYPITVRVDWTTPSENLLLQAVEQPGQPLLDIVGALHPNPQVAEPSPVHDAHLLQIQDVFQHQSPTAAEAMAEVEPHVHGCILPCGGNIP
jgi:hypothetical protein